MLHVLVLLIRPQIVAFRFRVRLYYHHGEYVQFNCTTEDDREEILQRLKMVTDGSEVRGS